MTRRFIGVRWWLGAAFALVAAVSTSIVVSQFSTQSENAFRSRAAELALGSAALADKSVTPANIDRIARQENLELRLYDATGQLIAAAAPPAGELSVPGDEAAA